MHALSNPAKYGLVIVHAPVPGIIRPRANQNTVISGEFVSIRRGLIGRIFIFVGLDSDRRPILADSIDDYKAKMLRLACDRMHA